MAKGQTREKGKCEECGADSAVHQRKVELCVRCNRKIFSWEHMRKVEGFMLLSWILVECRGKEWMNQMLLNKRKWQEWERWLRSDMDSKEWVEWWTGAVGALLEMVDGDQVRMLLEGQAKRIQVLALLKEYCETDTGEYKHAWQRRQMELIFADWSQQSSVDEWIRRTGDTSLEKWRAKGGESGSSWWKGSKLWDRRGWHERRRATEKQNKARRMELRKRDLEVRKEMREEEKRKQHSEKMRQKQEKSKDRHKRILMRVEQTGEKRGGEFERQWQQGKGCWVRTDKPRKRYAWMDDMRKVIQVAWAKSGKLGKERMRVAVVGGYYKWEGNLGDVQGPEVAERVAMEGEEVCSEPREEEPMAQVGRVRTVQRSRGQQRLLRPRIGPTTSTTSTPRSIRADRSTVEEDTRERLIGFFPKRGIG
jgi:hypothetical protein